MTISEVSTQEWVESTQAVKSLEQFRDQWKEPTQKIEEIWKSFRLLPLGPAYLIASHYQYDQPAWILTTKWDLFTRFDKVLRNKENPAQISSSIASAIKTQQRIAALQKTLASLKDSQTTHDKTHVYHNLQLNNPELYKEILHKVWIAQGKPAKQEGAEIEISKRSRDIYSKAVMERMLSLYQDGYRNLKDHFFENLLKKHTDQSIAIDFAVSS